MTLSEELTWRGFINQSTFSDIKELDNKIWTFYHGFDASADSQTIGNLAAMMFDKVFLRHGHKAIILAGGATSSIGDPGGKDKERNMQSLETILHNVSSAELQIKKIFGENEFTLVNNLDWTKDMNVLDFLRDIGKHFSMTTLVQRDYIASRIGEGGSGISYTEFSYTLLQGMDFLHLYDKFGCTLQLGGSDQWGNCLSGVDLIRKARGAETHTITINLVIDKTTGKKFGKSEAGAVWLDSNKTSAFKFYQFWINIDDAGVEYYLKIYTELSKAKIDSIMADHNESPSLRIAQKRLAFEVTSIVHGVNTAESVKNVSEVLFGGGDYKSLSLNDFKELSKEIKTLEVSKDTPLADLLVMGELASSKSDARRFLTDSAVYINGSQFSSNKITIESSDGLHGYVVVRRGKNNTILVKLK
ncbi:MAG: tyrosine--tRNA ligase [bacterium]